MRILITAKDLSGVGGLPAVARELALGFSKMGHETAVFSADPTPPEFPDLNHGIRSFNRIEQLPFQPDIIHGNHGMEAMIALMGCPGVPVLFHCHGAVLDDTQPIHPRIHQYLAMSESLRERMIVESGLDPERVQPFFNSVDLERFRTVRTPPKQLKKALFFNSVHTAHSPTLAAITEACRLEGIELSHAGRMNFSPIERPEEELPAYDLVFCSGKSALDALACGCAVMILGINSCGPLATTSRFDHLRRHNFSYPGNCPPPRADDVREQLQAYRAEDHAQLCDWVRSRCDLKSALQRLLAIYEQVIERAANVNISPEDELAAELRHLRRISPLFRSLHSDPEAIGVPRTKDVPTLCQIDARADELQADLARLF